MAETTLELEAAVKSGDAQAQAIPIADGIFMSQDVSNSYLVTTDAESLVVNTGTKEGGARHAALYAAVSEAPIRYVLFTQAHNDHFGGLHAFRHPGLETIAHARYPLGRVEREALRDFYTPRTMKLWRALIGSAYFSPAQEWPIDILVEDRLAFSLGDTRFEALSVPGGETLDSLALWLPDRGAVFTGNMFGPLFLHVPNLNTTRGDRQRSARMFLDSLDRVRRLDADLLITGHGEPIRGRDKVRADLTRLHDGVAYIHDATVAGMNAGKDVHTLMREIALPADLSLGEGHGNVRWAVRTVWEEYAGWFHYDATTSLYAVPEAAVHGDLVELAGGPDPLAARARAHLDAGRPLEALHLVQIALGAAPDARPALEVKRAALALLLEQGGGVNLSETMWLRSEIAEADEALA